MARVLVVLAEPRRVGGVAHERAAEPSPLLAALALRPGLWGGGALGHVSARLDHRVEFGPIGRNEDVVKVDLALARALDAPLRELEPPLRNLRARHERRVR